VSSASSPRPRTRPPRSAPETLETGRRAERVACDYLSSHGYRVLETNYRCRLGELDIVAEDAEGVLCFVEVRSRTRGPRDLGRPVETIGPIKQRRVVRAAEHYLYTRNVPPGRAMRFDVVGVLFDAQTVTLELLRDAFQTN
jgi:putative endonuclease